MDLEGPRKAIAGIKLPEWVKGHTVEADTHLDGEPFIRVWLDVDDDFEYAAQSDEAWNLQLKLKDCIYALGGEHWVAVTFRSPVVDPEG